MSVTIFKDIEEAMLREVRRITFHDSRTADKTVLEDTYDPFTGELVQTPIEPSLYDSSADASHIQYPHFFVKLQKTREDRFSARGVPQYGKNCLVPIRTSPRGFEIIAGSGDGVISAAGNDFVTTLFTINKVVPGYLLRLLSGNNIGTYIIDSVTPDVLGNHTITVTQEIVTSLPISTFDDVTRTVIFDSESTVDLNTVKVGDDYTDASLTIFDITAVDVTAGTIIIDGVATPDLALGSKIDRVGDVFTASDPSLVRFIIMDPTKPITATFFDGTNRDVTSKNVGTSPQIPIDAFYLVRIDNKEQCTHIEVLNRMWEEFNPPRTALPVIVRTSLSAEQLLTVDVGTGGSDTIVVEDNIDFNIGDPVIICDDLSPTKDDCGFARPFESSIKSKNINLDGEHEIILEDIIPDTFVVTNCPKIVSNTEFQLLMFHFQDHNTRDVEGSQYWVHEFTFMVQLWVDKLETPKETTVITDTCEETGIISQGVIFDC